MRSIRHPTARNNTKPTAQLLAELHAAIQKDLDRIFKAWPHIADQAATRRPPARPQLPPDPDDPRPHPDSIRAGGHTDPTAATALQTNPAREWSRQARHLTTQIHKLAVAIEHTTGGPVVDICEWCNAANRHGAERIATIEPGKSKRIGGLLYHAGTCHVLAARALKRQSVTTKVTDITAGQTLRDAA